MVTILEPKLDVSVEHVSPLPELQPKARVLEWGYAMPFPGVRYYSFLAERAPKSKAASQPLAVELIDERVILL